MDIVSLLKSARKVWLSTHLSSDGDGIGSELAFYHALRRSSVEAHVIHNDIVAPRYNFLTSSEIILLNSQVADSEFSSRDVAVIFDTNDPLICKPLIDRLQNSGMTIIFVDHHIEVKNKLPNSILHIDINASCTGELTYDLIQLLDVPLDSKIATCLYTSLLFDTQNFKNMRNPSKILGLAKILVEAGADHNNIQSSLFENWTINKFHYLAKLIDRVTYKNESTAIIRMSLADLQQHQLSPDEVSDIVDLFMGLKNLHVSIVVREESPNYFKLSFRSRKNEILSWAREFGGGGHLYSAGAWVNDSEKNILEKIETLISNI
jgi:bifunctional oligoribonuclease and PAP phosphatase NrnA